jgi:hypothetical protein
VLDFNGCWRPVRGMTVFPIMAKKRKLYHEG